MNARFLRSLLLAGLSWLAFLSSAGAGAAEPSLASIVKRLEIDPSTPVFVPVHPRIATTVTFPRPIGEPMGTGFVEADAFQKALSEGKPVAGRSEYLITYSQGDTFFTVQPMPQSELLNLNVPYEGGTLVLFFYRVDQPLSAVASLTFVDRGPGRARGPVRPGGRAPTGETASEMDEREPGTIVRREQEPPTGLVAASPARLDGFLRKLKLVHAAHAGPELDDLVEAMNLKVALSAAELPGTADIPHPVTHAKDFELILLRAVRDPALDCVGFVVLFRNTSEHPLVFDLRTLSARCGAGLYTAAVVDAPASLEPGQLLPGYFVVVGASDGRPAHLLPGNDWRLSVSLVAADEVGEEEELP